MFLEGAQITRTGQITLSAGRTHLKIKGLSPHMDEKSLQVKGEGDFTILSVNRQLDYLTSLNQQEGVRLIMDSLRNLRSDIKREQAKLEVIDGQLDLLNANQSFSGRVSGLEVNTLKEAMEYFKSELMRLSTERLLAQKNINQREAKKNEFNLQLKELRAEKEKVTSEVVIWVEADARVLAKFSVSYAASNAGWFPNYDIRAESVDSTIVIQYKAMVHQHTGEDWNNIKLTFSNANPNQSGKVPDLDMWLLVYNRRPLSKIHGIRAIAENASPQSVSGIVVGEDGVGLPGVNVLVKGSTVGTVTDIDGRYNLTLPNDAAVLVFSFIGMTAQEKTISGKYMDVTMVPDVTQLDEVVVSGYATKTRKSLTGSIASVRGVSSIYGSRASDLPVTQVENQTTVEFNVNVPYSINSSGEQYKVDLATYEIPATYKYYAVPKLDQDAFLVANIIDWDNYQLMEGEANLFLEGTFVGRTILDTRYLSDTLAISLGRDKNVVISRNVVEDYRRNRLIGGNKIDYVGWEIEARNKKSSSIDLTILDQLPVPGSNQITVNETELSGAIKNEQSGEVKWQFKLDPGQSKLVNLHYSVKYPKEKYLALDR